MINEQQIGMLAGTLNLHGQVIEQTLNTNTLQQQINNQYRYEIYNLQLKMDLLIKMMEEKGIMARGEFGQRWPLYLTNDVGVFDQSKGCMAGHPEINFYVR